LADLVARAGRQNNGDGYRLGRVGGGRACCGGGHILAGNFNARGAAPEAFRTQGFCEARQIRPCAGQQPIGICGGAFLQIYQLGNRLDGRNQGPVILW
jgi:hypothetical protein